MEKSIRFHELLNTYLISKNHYLFSALPNITIFVAEGFDNMADVTKMENESISFECEVSGNVSTSMQIFHFNNEKAEFTNSSKIKYDIKRSSCSDAGTYTCVVSINEITNAVATASLNYFVLCKLTK